MKETLARLFEYQTLSRDEAHRILLEIGAGGFNASQITAFLTVFQMRMVTVDELKGFRDALLELCRPVDLNGHDAIDLCGTGGDGKDTFNISTLASFVVAGAGIDVAKHGNYGVSSTCGSSNVMEHLGHTFTNDPDNLRRQIDEAGICFFHAPLFHPAMRHVAPIRRELGVKTFFNMLGPMVNPARPRRQLVGVFSLELARLYNYVFQPEEKEYTILHSHDGYDEISLTGPFRSITRRRESVVAPEDVGMSRLRPEQLLGGRSVAEAAKIFTDILQNNGTSAQADVVCMNAGAAIQCANPERSIEDCIEIARESLVSGRANNAFKKMIAA